jgi:hypothetical protein
MSKKSIGAPDSDQTAREPDAALDIDEISEDPGDIEGRQTSNKTGKHSSAEKLAASRPGFGSSPGAKPVDGAFGGQTPEEAGLRGPRLSLAGTNQFHCESCGRDFNTESELSAHEIECRLAKQAAHPK